MTVSALAPKVAPQIQRSSQNSAAAAPTGDVEFSINAQDSTVMSASTITLHGVGADVSTSKVKLMASLAPNSNGNYIFDEKSKDFTSSNAFAAVANVAALAEKVSGEPIVWATGKTKLEVTPDSDQPQFNANYQRQKGGTFYYHDTDPVTGEVIYSGNSAEVTGHECYHAILDSKRPHYLGSFSPDPGAFHEAMGDVGALLTTLHDPKVIDKVVEQTGGDLTKQNCAAALGEQLGIAINHKVGHDATGGPWTRNAINSFVWQDPSTLPKSAPPDKLSREVHSLSRLWSGAIYDILTAVVKDNMAQGQDAKTAITNGADDVLKMQFRLLEPGQAPDGSFKFRAMGQALVNQENSLNGGKYTSIITTALNNRKLLPDAGEAAMISNDSMAGSHEVSTTLNGDKFGQFGAIGARVSQVVSGEEPRGFLAQSQSRKELENDVAQLIDAGDIKMTQPNEDPSKVNLFKADGQPYRGVVRWESGQPVIEPTLIAR